MKPAEEWTTNVSLQQVVKAIQQDARDSALEDVCKLLQTPHKSWGAMDEIIDAIRILKGTK